MSTENVPTCWICSQPIPLESQKTDEQGRTVHEECQGQRIRVLVVEDHPMFRRSLCTLLSHDLSLNVMCESADGEDAVQKAEELQPDLVLLDISLPGITGIQAARRIR